jgi:hypothetical protein
MNNFYIGQIFEGIPSVQVSIWCNLNNATLVEIDDNKYKIISTSLNENIDLIRHILSEEIYNIKSKVAYGGIKVKKTKTEFIFETSKDSIILANSKFIMLQSKPDNYIINWKTWGSVDALLPIYIELTKSEFIKVFEFAGEMIEQCFAVESKLNSEILKLKDSKLADAEYINQVKQYIAESFKNIKTTISL